MQPLEVKEMSEILKKIRSLAVVKDSAYRETAPEFIDTGCLTLNVLFSGKMDGGIQRGKVSSIAAPPALGKSFVGFKVARNAQRQYGMDVIYMDSEFAYNPDFARNIGVDSEKFLVIQNNQIEEVQQILTNAIMNLPKAQRNDIIVIIDSWGGLVTNKTVADAMEGKDVADMTIAKKKNSLARILTGIGCTVFVINQTYECLEESTLVITDKGSVVIDKINVGDIVLTSKGYQEVRNKFYYKRVPIYEVYLDNGIKIEGTESHKFMVINKRDSIPKWKPIFEIVIGDSILTGNHGNFKDYLINQFNSMDGSIKVNMVQYRGFKNACDIETDCHDYVLDNGIVSHNSMNAYQPLTVGGGKGLIYASSSIVMGTSKAKSKDGDEVNGAVITAVAHKGRLAVENSKLKYLIKFEGGIHPYYGILEDALEGGYVVKPNQGWYTRPCVDGDKKWREKEIWENSKEFWKPVLEDTNFPYYMEKRYSFKHNKINAESMNFDAESADAESADAESADAESADAEVETVNVESIEEKN
jgi:hypothetical protein